MKALDSFTVERLEELSVEEDLYNYPPIQEELNSLARIALAAKSGDLFIGMDVGVDVSTCEADALNRYYGTVTEVSELETKKNGVILLVQDAEPNFTTTPQLNSPEIPDGWKLVPIEPTDAMQVAAANAIRFDTTAINKLWTGKRVFDAMLAAAPEKP
ncbi:hypothetical protein [Yersinia thracica]|uniref:hypothetical protein n=1 Tax=Yersinia thracica TaxID=2890319 RepID=UPI001F39C04E|nr:hypothetical protein [Yersinia thracica]